MKISKFNLNTNTSSIPVIHFQQEKKANKLLIMLPGAGYSCQAPLFHYPTGIYLQKEFDILQIQYNGLLEDIQLDDLNATITTEIHTFIKENYYTTIHVIAKSIGTIVLSHLLNKESLAVSKAIWLTPLLQREEVVKSMETNPITGLVIIGDKDPVFIKDNFTKLENCPHLTTVLIPECDYSLQLKNDVLKSIEVHKLVMEKILSFSND